MFFLLINFFIINICKTLNRMHSLIICIRKRFKLFKIIIKVKMPLRNMDDYISQCFLLIIKCILNPKFNS